MIPFLRPRPPRLSRLVRELEAIEASGIYTNYGPVNDRFEERATERLFGGTGGCLTVANATIGLMLAIREAIPEGRDRRYALMPSFTFAATAHAAIWAGLIPLFVDIHPRTWCADPDAVTRLLDRYPGEIACLVPYACFGNDLDLGWFAQAAVEHGTGLVVDGAASLGSMDVDGNGFGAGFPHAVVFSMHATKTFATSEGGLIHCGDAQRLARLRVMGNFGFGEPRSATMPGLNAKLSEIGALVALARLESFANVVTYRTKLAEAYRRRLPDLGFQEVGGTRTAYQFMPALLPLRLAGQAEAVVEGLAERGIGARHYFSPHLAQQPYFAMSCVADGLRVTDQVSARMLSLPMADDMTLDEVEHVCSALESVMGGIV